MIVQPPITKQPSELFPVSMDFAADLAVGETISTPTVTARNEKTGADSSAQVISGTPSVSAGKVIQKVTGGVDGENHIVTFKIVTSLTNTFEAESRLMIRET